MSSGTLTINGGIIKDNRAEYDGGGISMFGPFTVQGEVTVIGNEAGGSGGGILAAGMTDTAIIQNNVIIANNRAGTFGGGIFAEGGLRVSDNVTIQGNEAYAGGGIYSGSVTESVTIRNDVKIIYNKATTLGGGIFAEGGVTIGGDVPITSNEANSGGGIFASSNTDVLTLNDGVVISDNRAVEFGGGIYADDELLFINENTLFAVQNNTSPDGELYRITKNIMEIPYI